MFSRKKTRKGSYLECFDVRWIRRSHVETLHVGLEHALCDFKCHVTVQPSTFNDLLAPGLSADSPSSGWTWWRCSEGPRTAPLCNSRWDRSKSKLACGSDWGGTWNDGGASSPVVPQQPNQRLCDDADFRFGCKMPVELSYGHHHLKHSNEH